MGTYDKKLYKILGEHLRTEREKRKLSLEQIADRIGKTKKTVSRYELGEHRIDVNTIMDICNALDIDYHELNKSVEAELYQINNRQGNNTFIKDLDLARWLGDLLNNDDPDIYELLKIISTLEDDDLKTLLVMAKALKK